MDIPRPRNSFAAVAVLPAVLMPLSRAMEDDFALVAVGFILIAMAGALLLRCGFYMRRTPLVRIDETRLTFFGNAESDRQSFQRNAISSISLSRRALFWRSSFHFASLQTKKRSTSECRILQEVAYMHWLKPCGSSSQPSLRMSSPKQCASDFHRMIASGRRPPAATGPRLAELDMNTGPLALYSRAIWRIPNV